MLTPPGLCALVLAPGAAHAPRGTRVPMHARPSACEPWITLLGYAHCMRLVHSEVSLSEESVGSEKSVATSHDTILRLRRD